MAFPRSFKKQVWYLRLPSGEIEVVTPDELQRAFDCGLVEARTPVRAYGAHTWITMAEAAELPAPDPRSMASLSPLALDAPAADLDDGAPWRSRRDVDPQAFRPSRAPVLGALLLSVAFVALAVLGGNVPQPGPLERAAAAAAIAPAAPSFRASRPPMPELLHREEAAPEVARLTKAQKRRLRKLDYVTRTYGRKVVAPALRPSKRRRRAFDDPFARTSNAPARRGDPLDGSF